MMQSILSTLKCAISVFAFLCIFGIVGTMEYNDAVQIEQAERLSKRLNCTGQPPATLMSARLLTNTPDRDRNGFHESRSEMACGELTH
jgi:hypothetical protein